VLASFIKQEMKKMGAADEWFDLSAAIAEKFYHQCLTDGQTNQVKTRRVIRKVCGLSHGKNFTKSKETRHDKQSC
jgi:hypothetical protein